MLKMTQAVFVILLCISTSYAAYEDARCKCLCTDQSENQNKTKPTMKVFVKATSADKCTCKFMLDHEEALCPYCECKYQVRNTTTIKVVVFLILVVISGLTLYMVLLLLLEPLLSVRSSLAIQADNSIPSISAASILDDLSDRKLHLNALWRFIASPFANLKKEPPSMVDYQHRSPHSHDIGGDGDDDLAGADHSDSRGVILNSRQLSRQQLLPGHAKNAAGEAESYLYQRFPSPSRVDGTTGNDQPGNASSSRACSGVAVPLATSGASGVGMSTVVNRVRDQQQRWKGNVEAQRARVFSEHTLLN